MRKSTLTRRKFFEAGGIGAMGLAFAGLAQAQSQGGTIQSVTGQLTEADKTNLELVHAYDRIVTDTTTGLDRLQKLKEICSPTMIWGRVNGDKFLGLNAVIEWYESYFKDVPAGTPGNKILKYDYSQTHIWGPVIVEYGRHLISNPGGPPPNPNNIHAVVWVIRNGKLAERYDHMVPQRT
jgi:hypothetical protein